MSTFVRSALLVALIAVTPIHPAHAGESDGWDEDTPWNCVASADSCAKFSSPSDYVGPAYGDCIDITNGWKSGAYVEARCNND